MLKYILLNCKIIWVSPVPLKRAFGLILKPSMKQYTWKLPPSFLALELSSFCFLNHHFFPGHAILRDSCCLDCEGLATIYKVCTGWLWGVCFCLEVVFFGGYLIFLKHQNVFQEQFLVVKQLKIESWNHKCKRKFKLQLSKCKRIILENSSFSCLFTSEFISPLGDLSRDWKSIEILYNLKKCIWRKDIS